MVDFLKTQCPAVGYGAAAKATSVAEAEARRRAICTPRTLRVTELRNSRRRTRTILFSCPIVGGKKTWLQQKFLDSFFVRRTALIFITSNYLIIKKALQHSNIWQMSSLLVISQGACMLKTATPASKTFIP